MNDSTKQALIYLKAFKLQQNNLLSEEMKRTMCRRLSCTQDDLKLGIENIRYIHTSGKLGARGTTKAQRDAYTIFYNII